MTTTKADGDKIRRLREAKGLAGRELAAAAGIDFRLLSKVELGHLNGSPRTRLAIAQALGADLDDITYTVPHQPMKRPIAKRAAA